MLFSEWVLIREGKDKAKSDFVKTGKAVLSNIPVSTGHKSHESGSGPRDSYKKTRRQKTRGGQELAWKKEIREAFFPPVTLQMNKMGHLHVWSGEVKPTQSGKYNYVANGRDSDKYAQREDEINTFMNLLNPDEIGELKKGYPIITRNIPDDYLN